VRLIVSTLTLILLSAAFATPAHAASGGSFVVQEIRVDGLRRISEGTLFNYLPVLVGDEIDAQRSQEALVALFDTGFFNDVELRRDGETLVILVEERPGIRSFSFDGNRDIEDEELEDLLRGLGLAEGRILDRAILQTIEREFTSQYYSRGKYGAKVETEVSDVGDNQVEVAIHITEGLRAKIRRINIVGNTVFDDDELMGIMALSEPNWLSFYSNDDNYSSEDLIGDLEEIRSYYMDRGYANFQMPSTQVTLSHDRKDVYITIGIDEGSQYIVSEIALAGEMVVPEEQMERLVIAEPGTVYNQRLLLDSSELMAMRLGLDGYAFGRADPIPEFDHESGTVSITFLIQPGRRVYVRHINFLGSTVTDDEVFRREMRQLEGAWVSNALVDRSKLRLQRLPFIEEVDVETNPVPGSPDLVDVDFTVVERPPGSFNFGLGFSASRGLMLNAGVTHSNFLGRGERVSAQVSTSNFNQTVSFSHTNPYATVNGISRSFTVFLREADSLVSSGSRFTQNMVGGQVQFGYPISEYSTITFGVGYRDVELLSGPQSSQQIIDYVTNNGSPFVEDVIGPSGQVVLQRDGTTFEAIELQVGWTRDSRNRTIFANRGSRNSLFLEFTGPGSDVGYYTARYNFLGYWPVSDSLTVALNMDLAYGDGFGDKSRELPPFKNFLAGGPGSVRGFRESWLGPLDSFGRPYGGNVLLATQLELLLPVPEALGASTRFAVFFDIGNVFFEGPRGKFFDPSTGAPIDYGFNTSDLRRSYGIAATWLAPLGAMKFSYAFPMNAFAGDGIRRPDDLVRFQFTISNVF
jgi:outer membrane protein insertion porin family